MKFIRFLFLFLVTLAAGALHAASWNYYGLGNDYNDTPYITSGSNKSAASVVLGTINQNVRFYGLPNVDAGTTTLLFLPPSGGVFWYGATNTYIWDFSLNGTLSGLNQQNNSRCYGYNFDGRFRVNFNNGVTFGIPSYLIGNDANYPTTSITLLRLGNPDGFAQSSGGGLTFTQVSVGVNLPVGTKVYAMPYRNANRVTWNLNNCFTPPTPASGSIGYSTGNARPGDWISINWNSANANSASIGGFPNLGGVGLSGSNGFTVPAWAANSNQSVTLNVNGPGGAGSASASIRIGAAYAGDGNISVTNANPSEGQTITVNWNAWGDISGVNIDVFGGVPASGGRAWNVGGPGVKTVNLHAWGPGGVDFWRSVTVNVRANPPSPAVSLSAR